MIALTYWSLEKILKLQAAKRNRRRDAVMNQ